MGRCMNEGGVPMDEQVKMSECIQDGWMNVCIQGLIDEWMKKWAAAMLDQKADALFWHRFIVKL